MCGIVGVVGVPDASTFILNALERLTYRGYDSAGLVTVADKPYRIRRSGKIHNLKNAVNENPPPGSLGIGHTRWATHGPPTEPNAHPFASADERYFVICNGIIENFRQLKKHLQDQGVKFSSETDTETLAHLLQSYDSGLSLQEKLIKLLSDIQGSFALVVLDSQDDNSLWAARKGSPLLVAKGEGANYLCSDVPAILEHTRKVAYLNDGELVHLSREAIKLFDFKGGPLDLEFFEINYTMEQAEKDGYEHFMLKEIHEQPKVVDLTLKAYINEGGIDFSSCLNESLLSGIEEVHLMACGTAYHACLEAQYLFESLGLRARAHLASEAHLFPPPFSDKSLAIAITQSGETIDTLYAIRKAKEMGAVTMTICNVKGATLARESDMAVMMQAGPEIGVASTKAYSTMLAVVSLLGPWLANVTGKLPKDFDVEAYVKELLTVPEKIAEVLEKHDALKSLLENFSHFEDYFYIARGFNLPTAYEGALKLKEITYLHAEGYGAGEMKHGPIALVDEKLLTIALAPADGLQAKIMSNVEEIRARRGKVFLITSQGAGLVPEAADWILELPDVRPEFTPFLVTLPLQILAYEVAVLRGCDPDQPRNLAKSVTVE